MPVTVKFNHLAHTAEAGVAFLDSVVKSEAFQMEADMKKSMSGAKSGALYGNHRASAPGETPARDTGFLANSIHTRALGAHAMQVVVGAEYAPHLEYGTVHMAPRPYVAPAVERCRIRLSRLKIPSEVFVSGP